jgi:hypothetical protein
MPSKNQINQFEKEGRKFAKMLYDLPIRKLANPTDSERSDWEKEFPKLDKAAIENIIEQVREARLYQQERIGWQAIPHDLTVILFVLGTVIFDLKTGIITGIAALVFFESLFQYVFIRKYYRPLSLIVWLTYPAYIILGYSLYQQNYAWYWIVMIILVTWFGTFLLGQLARLPMRLIMDAKEEAQVKKSQEQKD